MQLARLEAAHVAARVGEREDEAAREVVVAAAVREAGGEQLLLRVALLERAPAERRAAGCEAEAELLAHVLAEPTAGEVLARERAPVALPQHALVERGRPLEQLLEPLAALALPGGLGRDLLVLDLDVEPLREELDRADEVDLLELLDERDRIAALAAAEALERPARRRDDEARRPLLVERAQPLVRAARLPQADVVLDERQDLGRRPSRPRPSCP